MNHVLKYVHGVDTLDDTIPTKGTYWADRKNLAVARVLKIEEATQEKFSKSVVHLEYLYSRTAFSLTVEKLNADFVAISTPPAHKPFAWLRKFFDKRQILSIRDIERMPQHKLHHLYVMNGLCVDSFVKHRVHTKIPFPVPKLIIPLSDKPNGKSGASTLFVWESWVPVDLLTQYTASTILNSECFRSAHAQGHLYILSTKYADHLLAQQDTQAEIQRMKETKEFVGREGAPRSLTAGNVPSNKIAPLPPHYKDLEVNNTSSGGVSTLSKNVEIHREGEGY